MEDTFYSEQEDDEPAKSKMSLAEQLKIYLNKSVETADDSALQVPELGVEDFCGHTQTDPKFLYDSISIAPLSVIS